MKTFVNYSAKRGDDGGKSMSLHKAYTHAQVQNWGQPAYKRQALSIFSPSLLRAYKLIEQFTPLWLPINEVFNTIKDQP